MKIIITESQLRKILSSIISKENNVYGIKQGMSLINESKSEIKKKIKEETRDEYIKIMQGYNGSWTEFRKDKMFYIIRKFFLDHYQYFKDYNWKILTSKLFPNKGVKDIEKMRDKFIKIMETYKSFNDFKKDEQFNNIYSFFNRYYNDNQYYNWKNIILEKFPKKNEERWEISKKETRDKYIKIMQGYNGSWDMFYNETYYFNKIYRFFLKYYNDDPYYDWEILTSKIFPDKDVESQKQRNKESKGEKKVKLSLIDLGYSVSMEKKFKGCYGLKGNRLCDSLRYDSYIKKKDGTEVCIEYDGEGHFMSISFFNGDIGLEQQQKHDQLKNDYCKNNGLKLIRIHYLDFNRIEEILENELGPYEQENKDNNMDMGIFYSRPEEYQHLT